MNAWSIALGSPLLMLAAYAWFGACFHFISGLLAFGLHRSQHAASSGVYLVVAASAFGAASHMGLPP